MKIDLDGIDLADLVQASVANVLTKSLGKTLPDIVDKLINDKPAYGGKENILRAALIAAIKIQVDKGVVEFIAEHETEIRDQVRAGLALALTPALISQSIIEQLGKIKVNVMPFSKTVKAPSIDDDED